mmetsp:Transcript_27993/g.58620  ORF Transcript_27993/g.58620 Transcript_27993/m.58620 type:complete len:80 (-) Transcript_27993:66-305(-)
MTQAVLFFGICDKPHSHLIWKRKNCNLLNVKRVTIYQLATPVQAASVGDTKPNHIRGQHFVKACEYLKGRRRNEEGTRI